MLAREVPAVRLQCPLDAVAARYTDDRSVIFDILLPAWLATYNKLTFGSLIAAGKLLLLVRWTNAM